MSILSQYTKLNPFSETPKSEMIGTTKKSEMYGTKSHIWNKPGGAMFSMHAKVFINGTARNDVERRTEPRALNRDEQLQGEANGNQQPHHYRGNIIAQQQPQLQHHPQHHQQQQRQESQLPPQAQRDLDVVTNTVGQCSSIQHRYEYTNREEENNFRQNQHPTLSDTNQALQFQPQTRQILQNNSSREYHPHNYNHSPPRNSQYQPYNPIEQNPALTDRTNILNTTLENYRHQNFQNLPYYNHSHNHNNPHLNPTDLAQPVALTPQNQHNTQNLLIPSNQDQRDHPNNRYPYNLTQQDQHDIQNRLNPNLPNYDQHFNNQHHNPFDLNTNQQNHRQDSLQVHAPAHANPPHHHYVYDVNYLRWWHAQMYPSNSSPQPNPRDDI